MDRSTLRQGLIEMVEDTTGEPCPTVTDELELKEGLGLDSVDLFGLVVETQTRYGIKIGSDELENVQRVGQFLDLLQAKVTAKTRAA